MSGRIRATVRSNCLRALTRLLHFRSAVARGGRRAGGCHSPDVGRRWRLRRGRVLFLRLSRGMDVARSRVGRGISVRPPRGEDAAQSRVAGRGVSGGDGVASGAFPRRRCEGRTLRGRGPRPASEAPIGQPYTKVPPYIL